MITKTIFLLQIDFICWLYWNIYKDDTVLFKAEELAGEGYVAVAVAICELWQVW